MTNFEKHIKESAREYSLSSDEKARMMRVISEYAQHKPIREAASVTVSYGWVSILYRPVAAALVLVLVTGSSVSYAAETALPGDALYGVKTGINEPVRVALATKAETKAEVQMELAERRIEEATVLAVEGRLDASTEEELTAAFESHAAAASESIAKADEEDATSELAARFENRLAAHEMVLAEVEFELTGGAEADVARDAHPLADAIRITNATLAEARIARLPIAVGYGGAVDVALMAADATATGAEPATMAMTMSVATEPAEDTSVNTRSAKAAFAPEPLPAPDARTISRMENAAVKSLKDAQKTLKNAKYLSAEAKARAEADIAVASGLLDDGYGLLEADADAEAFMAFQDSLRASEQASVFIKAAPALEKARARSNRAPRAADTPSGGGVDAVIDIAIPAASIDATVTIPAVTSTPSDDVPTSDGPSYDAPEDELESAPAPSSTNLIKSIINLDLSL